MKLNEIQTVLIDNIKSLNVSCPECENMDDEQYQCGTCGGQGGNNKINVFYYLKDNKDLL